jgi:hypothetical protein
MKKERVGYFILIVIAIISLTGLFILSPIEQSKEYHNFCDSNIILNIPNFWNVVSNIPFLIIGLIGLYKASYLSETRVQYLIFFAGITLVSIGSGYYHLNPNNNTLVWDRLPMTIAFMSLFSIIISEFIDLKIGLKTLFPALIVGLISVAYWIIFNDLKIYILVQFYPVLAILVILIFFKSKYNLTIGYWILLVAYIFAKFFEHFDYQTQSIIKVLSGHTLKHIVIAVGILCLLYTYAKRKKVNNC